MNVGEVNDERTPPIISFVFILILISFVCSLIPIRILRYGTKDSFSIQALGNIFSGSILVTAGIMHMLQEALPTDDDDKNEKKNALVFFLLGILVPIVVDSITDSIFGSHHHFVDLESENGEYDDNRSKEKRISNSRGFLLSILLSFHSIVEGAALGKENSFNSSIKTFFAIIGHKIFASFSLGMSLSNCRFMSNQKRILLIVLFSLSTPLGIAFSSFPFSSFFPDFFLKAFAGGMFLYIGLIELILPSFKKKPSVSKAVLLCFGSFIMVIISRLD